MSAAAVPVEASQLLERIDSSDLNLPVMPDFALKLLEAIKAGQSAQELAPLVDRDPVLCGQMLRLANSAAFAGKERVNSVSQAVARVGMRTVANFVNANLQRSLYRSVDPRAAAYLRQLWRHSLGAAIVAQHVARVVRERDVEQFFLAGLLHDLGRTALVALLPPGGDGGWPPAAVFAALHVDASRRLLTRWTLPADVVAAIAAHHAPAQAGPQARLAAAVTLADGVCYRVGVMPEGSDASLEIGDAEQLAAAKILKLSEIQIADLEVELEDRVAELDAVFGG